MKTNLNFTPVENTFTMVIESYDEAIDAFVCRLDYDYEMRLDGSGDIAPAAEAEDQVVPATMIYLLMGGGDPHELCGQSFSFAGASEND